MRNSWRCSLGWIASVLAVLVLSPNGYGGCWAAAPDSPAVKKAIDRGARYLKQCVSRCSAGSHGLVAYALLKAGVDADDEAVSQLMAVVSAKVRDGEYSPHGHHVYEAGVDLMGIEAVDPDLYRPEMEAIVRYLVAQQNKNGQWDYPTHPDGGDTSISQYAVLGLWAAARAGIEVPPDTWNRSAAWHVKSQKPDGGFLYHPGRGGPVLHSMSVAGTASLCVAKLHLYPDDKEPVQKKRKVATDTQKRLPQFDMLERVDFATGETIERRREDAKDEQKALTGPRVALATLQHAITTGSKWIEQKFTIDKPTGWPLYYLYGLERMAALVDAESFAGHDWYAEGTVHLLREQKDSGGWKGTADEISSTCFALLFLTRATAKLLNRPVRRAEPIGVGLLAGGRGLPDDLAQAKSQDGKITVRKVDAPIDKLLAELANPDSLKIDAVQATVVETVQLGNREELIGQKELLKQLVDDPRAEVRRTALWALGRCDDLGLVPLLVDALEDPDVDVVIETRNALCTLTRQPNGIEEPSRLRDSPFADLPENASDGQRAERFQEWRAEVVRRWRGWYLKNRRYDERDDLLQWSVK